MSCLVLVHVSEELGHGLACGDVKVKGLHPHDALLDNLIDGGLGGPGVGLAVAQLGETVLGTQRMHVMGILLGEEVLSVGHDARLGVDQVHIGSHVGEVLDVCMYACMYA